MGIGRPVPPVERFRASLDVGPDAVRPRLATGADRSCCSTGGPANRPTPVCEAADYVTRNPFARVDVPPSGLVTVTSRKLAVAVPATDIRTVMLVELLRVTELMVMPLPENATPTPVAKLVPLIVMFCGPVPRAFEFGLSDVIVGRAVTVKEFDSVEVPPSGLVTVTLRTPVAAVEDTETLTVNLDEF